MGLADLVSKGKYDEASVVLLREFSDWSPELQAFLKVPCEAMAVRPSYTLKDHVCSSNALVTLLGDAVHVTVPDGDDANTAMLYVIGSPRRALLLLTCIAFLGMVLNWLRLSPRILMLAMRNGRKGFRNSMR